MNPSEDKLSKALRELAADSPQNAPEELRVRLTHAFIRHHQRRRLVRSVTLAGMAACLLMGLALWLTRKNSSPPSIAVQPPQSIQPAAKIAPGTQEQAKLHAPKPLVAANARRNKIQQRKAVSNHAVEHAAVQADSNEFVALPMFDPDIPVGQSRMVRIELSGAALRLVGYPVNEDLSERRIVTDVLLAQDGTPYAVRLVKTQAFK